MKIAIVGHVDHGKSTFVGRLLHDTGSLPEGKLAQLEQIARNHGVPFEWANVTDALRAERDQNITIDTAPIGFHTPLRQYLLIDTPGHKEFLKNMVTGAANADAALLLIDAAEGVQENSRRHGYLLHFLGIRQIAVLVNKMDRADYREEKFLQVAGEYRAWLKTVGVEPAVFIPVAARHGDNLGSRSPNMPWWQGPTVLEALDKFSAPEPPRNQPLRFPVQDIHRFDDRRILVGRVEAGSLKVGDQLVFSPTDKASRVKSIERWHAPASEMASAGESIGVTLEEHIFVPRGAIGALASAPPLELSSFKARLFWLGKAPLAKGKRYKLKLATQEVECRLEAVEQVIDASTLAPLPRAPGETFVARHEVAEVLLHTKRPIAFDVHTEIAATGRFVIVDELEVSGGGIILEHNYPRRAHNSRLRSQNIFWSQAKVTLAERQHRNGHPGCVLWLTGLPSSGKSTIAIEVEHQLFELGWQVNVLDGDNIRHGLGSDLGFSPRDRTENIRRVGEVAKLFAQSGFICLTAFVSPYRADRDLVRQMLPPGCFIEVFINAPVEVCEQRDPKGLYAKARACEIKEFTGVSAPYEPPLAPELELRTDQLSIADSAARLIEFLSALPRT